MSTKLYYLTLFLVHFINIHPSTEFEGWTVSSITYKEGRTVTYKEGMTVTAKYGEKVPDGSVQIEFTLGEGFKNMIFKPDAEGNIILPTFEEISGDFAKDKIFKGWRVFLKVVATSADETLYPAGTKFDPNLIEKIEAVYVNLHTMDIKIYRIKGDASSDTMKTVSVEVTTNADNSRTFEAPANPFSYSGKRFDSWETNFNKDYYYAGETVTVPASFTDPIALYGYWVSGSSSSGGGGSSSTTTKYSITASAGKGGSISPSGDVEISKGSSKTFKITANEGYVVADVMVDGDSVGAVKSFTISDIKKDMTIKAIFETTGGEPTDGEDTTDKPTTDKPTTEKGTFTDINGHWAENYINTVAEKGLFAGMTKTTFAPDVAMTRAMFVTVLGRMSGVDTTKYTSSNFSDVAADSWFGPYVSWAAQSGIISGLSSTTFGPNDSITREQMALILVNYAKATGLNLPTKNDAMMFTDNASIGNWAKEAVFTAQKAGLLNGRTSGSFDPQGKATRAEVTTVFVQLDSLK